MLFDRGMVSDRWVLAGPELQLSPESLPRRSVPHSLCCPCITCVRAALMFSGDAFKSIGEVELSPGISPLLPR